MRAQRSRRDWRFPLVTLLLRVERRDYARVFDAAVPRVSAWEQRQLPIRSWASLGSTA